MLIIYRVKYTGYRRSTHHLKLFDMSMRSEINNKALCMPPGYWIGYHLS